MPAKSERRKLPDVIFDDDNRLLTRAPVPEDGEDVRAGWIAETGRLTKKATNLYRATIHVTLDLPVIALVRYGGLRCPSEVLSLRWWDIGREHECFRVFIPETEHLQVMEADFEKATFHATCGPGEATYFATKPGHDAGCQETTEPQGVLGVRHISADSGGTWQESLVAGTGFEPATSRL